VYIEPDRGVVSAAIVYGNCPGDYISGELEAYTGVRNLKEVHPAVAETIVRYKKVQKQVSPNM
jgi:hypothetical protein